MVRFVYAFAKLSTAKSASFDDIRKGNWYNENIIFMIKGLRRQVLNAISNSTTRNYQMRNVQPL
jgi:hypothetical protein